MDHTNTKEKLDHMVHDAWELAQVQINRKLLALKEQETNLSMKEEGLRRAMNDQDILRSTLQAQQDQLQQREAEIALEEQSLQIRQQDMLQEFEARGQKTNEVLQDQVKELNDDKARLSDFANELLAKMNEMQKESKVLESKKDSITRKETDLKEKLRSFENKKKKHKDLLIRQKRQVSNTKSENSRVSKRLERLRVELNGTRKQLKSTEKELAVTVKKSGTSEDQQRREHELSLRERRVAEREQEIALAAQKQIELQRSLERLNNEMEIERQTLHDEVESFRSANQRLRLQSSRVLEQGSFVDRAKLAEQIRASNARREELHPPITAFHKSTTTTTSSSSAAASNSNMNINTDPSKDTYVSTESALPDSCKNITCVGMRLELSRLTDLVEAFKKEALRSDVISRKLKVNLHKMETSLKSKSRKYLKQSLKKLNDEIKLKFGFVSSTFQSLQKDLIAGHDNALEVSAMEINDKLCAMAWGEPKTAEQAQPLGFSSRIIMPSVPARSSTPPPADIEHFHNVTGGRYRSLYPHN
eukprot:TRINITY_DN4839_c3_g1_i1.p1 TRINITY_DN4839_c3_g1~~TRINITY_DN4839_c3_g1_i1.p1  ORF type:complete len:532 (-),score=185.95 TRINITY_DN4839_c3_g1_i1:195-1790(-)